MAANGNIVQGAVGTPIAGPRIVVGLDYGTTSTELAWAQTDGQATFNSLSDLELKAKLTVFRDWPGRAGGAGLKVTVERVPSQFSYSNTKNGCQQWGWSIDDDSNVLRWTKLDLEPRSPVGELDVLRHLMKGLDLVRELRANKNAAITNDIPRHIARSSEDVVQDYLGRVAREWYIHMKGETIHALQRVPVDLVITHPANWSYEAMNKTYRAVMGAFTKGMFPTLRDISFASEPEAWALYTVQDLVKKGHDILIPGECFVLCDAGGGTVDLVSYRINSVEPLELVRVGSPYGAQCGAEFVDLAFLKWLHPRVPNLDISPKDFGTGGHMVLKRDRRFLLDRFERVKHGFDGTKEGNITLPSDAIAGAGYEKDIINGVLSLDKKTLKQLFDESVSGTLNLIGRQIAQVENLRHEGTRCEVTNIFLVGGFAESEHLFKEVKSFARTRGHMKVQRAENCWIGVVKGAILRGMGIGMAAAATVRPCPRHYGICVSQKYEAWRNSSDNTVRDSFNGETMVPDQLFWLIRKGDAILPDGPIVSNFSVRCKFTRQQYDRGSGVRITFVASSTHSPPTTLAKLPRDKNEIIYLDVKSKLIPEAHLQKQKPKNRAGSYYTADVNVEIKVSQKVEVRVKHIDSTLISVETNL